MSDNYHQRLGDNYSSIQWTPIYDRKNKPGKTQPVVGELRIGSRKVEVTVAEMNRIIEELNDGLHVLKVSNHMGLKQNRPKIVFSNISNRRK